MGLLDDAIREHLDLKRRRGADPTEVERAEREALGPVRRAPESAPGRRLRSPTSRSFRVRGFRRGSRATYEDASPETRIAAPPLREPAFDQESDSWSYEDAQSEAEVAPPPPAPPLLSPGRAAVRAEPALTTAFADARRPRRHPASGRRPPAARRSNTTSKPLWTLSRRMSLRAAQSPPRGRTGRTFSRRRPNSSRTPRTMTACGSNSVRPRTSTSTADRRAGGGPYSTDPRRLRERSVLVLSSGSLSRPRLCLLRARRSRPGRGRGPALGYRRLPGASPRRGSADRPGSRHP